MEDKNTISLLRAVIVFNLDVIRKSCAVAYEHWLHREHCASIAAIDKLLSIVNNLSAMFACDELLREVPGTRKIFFSPLLLKNIEKLRDFQWFKIRTSRLRNETEKEKLNEAIVSAKKCAKNVYELLDDQI